MNYKDYLITVVQAAIEAGDAALEVYEREFEVEEKADRTPLTLADRRSHEIIAARLKPTGIPILSEEGRNIEYEERQAWKTLWIVDPLDGTKEFIKRNGEFTINIALVQEGRPVMGGIFVPVQDRLYFAAQDLGAFRIIRRNMPDGWMNSLERLIAAAERLPVEQKEGRPYTIVGSRSHATPGLETFVEEKRRQHERVEFISAGSSLKFCQVAEGFADIYPRFGPTMEWDTAAGQAVAEQAGAAVRVQETGKPMGYNKPDLTNPWFIVSRSGE